MVSPSASTVNITAGVMTYVIRPHFDGFVFDVM